VIAALPSDDLSEAVAHPLDLHARAAKRPSMPVRIG
jgi:hypothetical protein